MTDTADDANGRRLEPGTIGITIKVIEYDGATGTYETVKSATYAPCDPDDGMPVSAVRPFVLATMPDAESGRGAHRGRYGRGR